MFIKYLVFLVHAASRTAFRELSWCDSSVYRIHKCIFIATHKSDYFMCAASFFLSLSLCLCAVFVIVVDDRAINSSVEAVAATLHFEFHICIYFIRI